MEKNSKKYFLFKVKIYDIYNSKNIMFGLNVLLKDEEIIIDIKNLFKITINRVTCKKEFQIINNI